ncbi:transmembrane protein [Candidatus Magnetomorum sp. HK-1]|nr:transmembrane protein [Candidatus Magnetomorum sp. HK-1]
MAMGQDRAQLMKAGFLAKFVQFTSWPVEPKSHSDEFIITVIGKDPIYSVLKKIYTNKKMKNFPIKVKQVHKLDEIENPHILYITKAMESELDTILKQIQGKAIMTVGDTDGFCKRGVLINFYITSKGTLHFEFNSTVMKQSPLKINLLLLEIAKVIQ